jgi:hypothetical protein
MKNKATTSLERILDMVSGGKLNVTANEKLASHLLKHQPLLQLKLSAGEEARIGKS